MKSKEVDGSTVTNTHQVLYLVNGKTKTNSISCLNDEIQKNINIGFTQHVLLESINNSLPDSLLFPFCDHTTGREE